MATNPWYPFIQETPEIAWGALKPQFGPQNYMDYWNKQYGNVYDKYMGRLGQMALAGQPPNLEFTDFLGAYPFLDEWLKKAPWARGERSPAGLRWNIPW